MSTKCTVALLLLLGGCGAVGDLEPWEMTGGKGDGSQLTASVTWYREIPLFGQADTRWGGRRLFNRNSCRTMASAGCVITSLAMLNSYYGNLWTPDHLNDCVARHGGRVGCDLDLTRISPECLEPGMAHQFQIWRHLYSEMRGQLDVGNPLLARVSRSASCGATNTGDHTVLVTGYDGAGTQRANFHIYDPAGRQGSAHRLSAFPKVCYLQYITGPMLTGPPNVASSDDPAQS